MKKTIALILALIMSATALSACSDPSQFSDSEKLSNEYTRSTDPTENYNYNDGVESAPSVYNNYTSYITNFELRMFRNHYALAEDKNSSFVLAPINSVFQLGLIANGASGDTRNEISLALGGDLTFDDINKCTSYFKSRMEAVSKATSGEVNELSATLQSGDPFAVPNNLYIVGTMNSADKSISLIDAALRRRFSFIEQRPEIDLVEDPILQAVLKEMNLLLAKKLESTDLLVGHSYIINKKVTDLCDIMNNSIIPLLYEYFYDQRKRVSSLLDEIIAKTSAPIAIDDNAIGRLRVKEKTDGTE